MYTVSPFAPPSLPFPSPLLLVCRAGDQAKAKQVIAINNQANNTSPPNTAA